MGGGASAVIRTVSSMLISGADKIFLEASPIPLSTDEVGHFATALAELTSAHDGLDLFRMVAYAAGGCSQATAELVRSKHPHFIFGLDRNQPMLLAEATRLLSHLPDDEALATDEHRRQGKKACAACS